MNPITGSLVAIITPMHEDGSLDLPGLRRLVDYHIQEGTDAIVAVGTTGESPTVDVEEHHEVIRVVIEQAAGRVPVIAGTGANSTAEAIEMNRAAKVLGADATLSVVPYYNKPSQEGLYQHFKTIADAVDIPMLLYNVPGRTVTNMLPATVARLAQLPQVIGIKEACGSLAQISELLMLCPRDFVILSGDDFTALPSVYMGGKGVISVVSNLEPGKMALLMEAAFKKDFDTANRLHFQLFNLMGAMFCYPSPAPAKKGLELMGKIASSEVRLPMVAMDAASLERLQHDMRQLGLL